MAAADLQEEIRSVGERLLLKLRALPQAEPVELVAFSIIVVFTVTVLLMMMLVCSCCCMPCCCLDRRVRKIAVLPLRLR
ncbi:small integral membrane protein 5 [Mesocricetus auratus]|uniref:Small integral membrane protein 5 n=1 Tax=Mesocricetus auratus TaxID=10036 RepID=A0A1U8BNR8_MESAU|nr:small integral membrane protein 5 [Mesocricetus auratus]